MLEKYLLESECVFILENKTGLSLKQYTFLFNKTLKHTVFLRFVNFVIDWKFKNKYEIKII